MARNFTQDLSISKRAPLGFLVNRLKGYRVVAATETFPPLELSVNGIRTPEDYYRVYTWSSHGGWLLLLSLNANDFPFTVTYDSLEECFSYMEEVAKDILSPHPQTHG